jgi:inosose dehydratase
MPYLTVMDWGHNERDYAAGHSDRAPRLSDAAWTGMVANIRAIADLARSPAGFCLDTGHLFYAGMDPVETLAKYADRRDYIHFKDIDRTKFEEVMGRHIRFFEACGEGVMCLIGRGCIDYPAIRQILTRMGYTGIITVEQERDPRNAGGSLADVKASRDYLAGVGF